MFRAKFIHVAFQCISPHWYGRYRGPRRNQLQIAGPGGPRQLNACFPVLRGRSHIQTRRYIDLHHVRTSVGIAFFRTLPFELLCANFPALVSLPCRKDWLSADKRPTRSSACSPMPNILGSPFALEAHTSCCPCKLSGNFLHETPVTSCHGI